MLNTTHTLENLFKLSSFRIPQYQRAYPWEEEPQLSTYFTAPVQRRKKRKLMQI